MNETIGFSGHDHRACIADAMAAAETLCAAQKLQFTPVRRRVLEILLSQHRATGAYDILAQLDAEGMGSQPPVVYRALDFLVKHGLAHKIERLNAYIACAHPRDSHAPVFMICRNCRSVGEARSRPDSALQDAARQTGFAIESTVVEALGLCPQCQDSPA